MTGLPLRPLERKLTSSSSISRSRTRTAVLTLDQYRAPSTIDDTITSESDDLNVSSSSSSSVNCSSSLDPSCLQWITGSGYLSQLLSPSSLTPLSSLTHLDLSNRYIKDAGCAQLCAALVHFPNITVLDLRSNDLHPPSCLALATLLAGPPQSSSASPPLSPSSLAPSSPCSIHTLILEWNSLGEHPSPSTPSSSSSSTLLSALFTNPTLTHLDLRNNSLTSPFGQTLGRLLSTNRSLLTIDLRWNSLSKDDGDCIADGLLYNGVVEEVRVVGNGIVGSVMDQIEGMCKKNRESKASLPSRSVEDGKRREMGWKEMQDELREATSTIVRLQMEVREKDARLEGMEERVRGVEERRAREVVEVEAFKSERAHLEETHQTHKAKLRARDDTIERLETELRRAKEREQQHDQERVQDAEQREAKDAEIRRLKAELDSLERTWSNKLHEAQEKWVRDEDDRRVNERDRLKSLQRELEQLRAESSVREEESKRRIDWLTQERTTAEGRQRQAEAALSTSRATWEEKMLQTEQSMSASSQALISSLQSQLLTLQEGRTALLLQIEKERVDGVQRVQAAQAAVARLEQERIRWEGAKVMMEGDLRAAQTEAEQAREELKREKDERREEVDALMRQQGEEWRKAEERWREGEEERKQLRKRLEDVERDREKREHALHSAMTALQVTMQQMGYAASSLPPSSFPFPSLAQAVLAPMSPSPAHVAPPSPSATSVSPPSHPVSTAPGPVASPSPRSSSLHSSSSSGSLSGLPLASGRAAFPQLSISTEPPAVERVKPREQTKPAEESKLAAASLDVEVEVEVDAAADDDAEWEKEMQADMEREEKRRQGKITSPAQQLRASSSQRVTRVADPDVEVEIEYSEGDEEVEFEEDK